MTRKRTRKPPDPKDGDPTSEASQDDKGNGKPLPSTITIVFPHPNAAEPDRIGVDNAGTAQVIVAGFYLLANALWQIMGTLNAQEAQRQREAAIMESIMKGGVKPPTKD